MFLESGLPIRREFPVVEQKLLFPDIEELVEHRCICIKYFCILIYIRLLQDSPVNHFLKNHSSIVPKISDRPE